MFSAILLPDASGVEIEAVEVDQERAELVLTLHTTASQALCPVCHQVSHQVHSHYIRTLADLPCATLGVHWVLQVRRFFCRNEACTRKIFTERLPALAVPWSRRTQRLREVQSAIGIAVGGHLGAWLLSLLRMATSVDTLLRLIRKTPLPDGPTPRVLGVDDWAKHKGMTYGTLLVDLDRHQPVEVLPDRQAATLAAWLRAHPGVEIISRDRAGAYAEAAAQGAPNALQVADRWHLLKNLSDTLSRVLERYRRVLQRLTHPVCIPEPLSVPLELDGSSPLSPAAAARVRQRRAQRYQRYQQVCALRQQGWTLAPSPKPPVSVARPSAAGCGRSAFLNSDADDDPADWTRTNPICTSDGRKGVGTPPNCSAKFGCRGTPARYRSYETSSVSYAEHRACLRADGPWRFSNWQPSTNRA